MKRTLIFISSLADARATLHIIKQKGYSQTTVIGNDPQALILLKQHGINAIDSSHYFSTRGRSIHEYQKIVHRSKLLKRIQKAKDQLHYNNYYFGDILDFGLTFYLSELKHSLLVTEEILKVEKPDVIYVSPKYTESPMKKYQSENLNCENRALYEIARTRSIKVVQLRRYWFPEYMQNSIAIIHQFSRSIIFSLKQLVAKSRQVQLPPLIVLANYYQLVNLLPTLRTIQKNQISFVVLTKNIQQQSGIPGKENVPLLSFDSFIPMQAKITELRIFLHIKYFILWIRHFSSLKREFNKPGEWQLIKWKLFYYYTVQIPELIEWLRFADQFFSQHPKLLLTTATTDLFSKCMALSAREHDVPIIELLHGFLIFDEEVSFRLNNIFGVWGPAILPLLDQKTARQHALMTGYPYKLALPKIREIKTLTIRSRLSLGIGKTEKVLLVLAAYPVSVTRFFSNKSGFEFINTIISSVKATKSQWTVIFRSHPSNTPDWIEKLPIPSAIKIRIDYRQRSLDQLISASDYVIANHTTTLLMALAQQKALFFYSFSHPDSYPYVSHPLITSGAAKSFQTAKELTRLLKTTPTKISSEQRRNIFAFLKEYCSLPATDSSGETLIRLCRQFL